MTSTLLDTTLLRADESRSFHILAVPSAGWEATQMKDQHVVERKRYIDWHRVERARAAFAREIEKLQQGGWCEP
jgi:hypothetical protein